MKGVILGICPEASLVDISHEIEPFNIHQAAWTLKQAWNCFPPATVHLVVVDPGVGSSRRPLASRAAGHFFVGPDNGVLAPVLDADSERVVYEIGAAEYFRQPVSDTFHGRDIFAPIAAHLAAGLEISKLGPPVPTYVPSGFGKPTLTQPGHWTGTIVNIDRFGNIVTNFDWEWFHQVSERPFEMRIGAESITTFRKNYSHAVSGEYFLIKGSLNFLEVSAIKRNAANSLAVTPGMTVSLRIH